MNTRQRWCQGALFSVKVKVCALPELCWREISRCGDAPRNKLQEKREIFRSGPLKWEEEGKKPNLWEITAC